MVLFWMPPVRGFVSSYFTNGFRLHVLCVIKSATNRHRPHILRLSNSVANRLRSHILRLTTSDTNRLRPHVLCLTKCSNTDCCCLWGQVSVLNCWCGGRSDGKCSYIVQCDSNSMQFITSLQNQIPSLRIRWLSILTHTATFIKTFYLFVVVAFLEESLRLVFYLLKFVFILYSVLYLLFRIFHTPTYCKKTITKQKQNRHFHIRT